jgi:hypothetical protein
VTAPDATAGGDWTPEFPGQRPPFGPGNETAVVHGARSERTISDLAEKIEAGLLTDEATPDWVQLPRYAGTRAAYARSLAIVLRLTWWLDSQDIETVLTDKTTTEEVEEQRKGRTTRRSTSTRVISVLSELHRAETRTASLAKELGLTPASEAALTKNLSQASWYQAASPLDQALAQIEQDRHTAIGASIDDSAEA